MIKRVITSSDTNLDYAFFIPIVNILWKRLGYKFHVFLNGSLDNWISNSKNSYILNLIDDLNISSNIITDKHIKYDSWALSSFIRLFGSCFQDFKNPIKEDDYILTTDIDMLPLNIEWFSKPCNTNGFDIYGEDGETGGYGYTRYPICYIGALAKHWKNFMAIDDTIGTIANINKHINFATKDGLSDGQKRSLDETYFHYKMNQSSYSNTYYMRKMIPNPSFVSHDNKTPFILPEKRIDRSNWDLSNLSDAIDCHCMRPGYSDENWPKIQEVLASVLNETDLKFCNDYREGFIHA